MIPTKCIVPVTKPRGGIAHIFSAMSPTLDHLHPALTLTLYFFNSLRTVVTIRTTCRI